MTVFHCVAETSAVQRECTEMVPETRTRTETFAVQVPTSHQETEQYQVCVPTFRDVVHTYTVAVPIWTQQEEKFTVMVPHTETRQATRQVVHCIPASETRMVCVDRGHWEQARTCGYSGCTGSACGGSCSGSACGGSSCGGAACGSCGGCNSCCNTCAPLVWVPKIVQEGVQVTVMKPQISEEPYQYCVTVCSPEIRTRMIPVCNFENQARTCTERVCETKTETRTRTFTVCGFQTEQRSREVQFCVNVPQKRTWTEQVTNYRNVPEEKTEQYTVMVPHEVERDVCVQVCHMVAKEVPVQTCCSCDRCSRGCRRGAAGTELLLRIPADEPAGPGAWASSPAFLRRRAEGGRRSGQRPPSPPDAVRGRFAFPFRPPPSAFPLLSSFPLPPSAFRLYPRGTMTLPIRIPPVVERWDCHGCGRCCRAVIVPLSEADLARLESQHWDQHPDFRGVRVVVRQGLGKKRYRLALSAQNQCVFLTAQGRCRIHELHGEAAKPLLCRMFPFQLVSLEGYSLVTLRRHCPSAAADLGRTLEEQLADIRQLAQQREEEGAGKGTGYPPGAICPQGPKGARHKRGLSPFPPPPRRRSFLAGGQAGTTSSAWPRPWSDCSWTSGSPWSAAWPTA